MDTPGMRRIGPSIWSIEMDLPKRIGFTSRTYVIDGGDEGIAIVDPGWPLDSNVERLSRAFETRGWSMADISMVFGTHAHLDHFGLAGFIQRLSGARVVLGADEQSHFHAVRLSSEASDDPSVRPGRARRLAEIVEVAEWVGEGDDVWTRDWRFLPTAGHTSGSACLINASLRIAITGDSLLPGASPGLGLGGEFATNPFDVYESSLDVLEDFDGFLGLPGHGGPVTDMAYEVANTRAHHRRRRALAASSYRRLRQANAAISVTDVVRAMDWKGGFQRLEGDRLRSALRQAEIYLESSGVRVGHGGVISAS